METEFQEKEKYVEKDVEPICSKELDIKDNPILESVAEMNESFINTQKLLDKADWEYEQGKKEIDEMIQIMPKYSQTIMMAVVQRLIMHADQSTFLGKRQQEILKKGMQNVIKIASESLEDFDIVEKKQEETEPEEAPSDKGKSEQSEIVEEPKKEFDSD